MGAPPSLHVECRWQSPRSASRYRWPSGGDRHLRLRLDLRQVGRLAAGERIGDHRSRRRPDPVDVGQRAGRRSGFELVGRRGAHHVEGPDERLRLEAALVRTIEAVDHPQDGLLGRHRAAGPRAPSSTAAAIEPIVLPHRFSADLVPQSGTVAAEIDEQTAIGPRTDGEPDGRPLPRRAVPRPLPGMKLSDFDDWARAHHGIITFTASGLSRSAWYRAIEAGTLDPIHPYVPPRRYPRHA